MSQTPSQQSQLYAARTHIYPRSVSGRFRNMKLAVLVLALSLIHI